METKLITLSSYLEELGFTAESIYSISILKKANKNYYSQKYISNPLYLSILYFCKKLAKMFSQSSEVLEMHIADVSKFESQEDIPHSGLTPDKFNYINPEEISKIVDLAKNYDKNLNIISDWQNNPNLISDKSFKQLVEEIATNLEGNYEWGVDGQGLDSYYDFIDLLINAYSDFYNNIYLYSETASKSTEFGMAPNLPGGSELREQLEEYFSEAEFGHEIKDLDLPEIPEWARK